MIIPYHGKVPQIGKNVFIAPTAVVIGDVILHDGASIWYGTVLRGDMDPIIVGRGSNIQDNCTVHTDYGSPADIGANVTVGHNAIVHGCRLEDSCLVGINATVLTGAKVGCGSVVAAGAVVMEGQTIPPGYLAAGIPAKTKKQLPVQSEERLRQIAENYHKLAQRHLGLDFNAQ